MSDSLTSKICDSISCDILSEIVDVINSVTFRCMTFGLMRLATFQFESKLQKCIKMGITIFKIFIFFRYIIGYTFGNHVLRLCLRVAVKLNFRPYIRRYTSPNAKFENMYPLFRCKSINTCPINFVSCDPSCY